MNSLDPRINRFHLIDSDEAFSKTDLDQLETYEVFVQASDKRAFQHEGIVHAPNAAMAFLFAKEQFSRRYTCTGIWIARTQNVRVTEFTEDGQSIYDSVNPVDPSQEESQSFEVFHLMKRGKQHKHVGQVKGTTYQEALWNAKNDLSGDKPVLNVWLIKTADLFMTSEEDKDIWYTLPEKKFRDAIDYKGAEKIREFKDRQAQLKSQ